MRLTVCERGSMIADLTISDRPVLIGSHPACDIYLPDGRIAPRQLIIEPEGQAGWTVRPLDTSIATTVNKSLLRSRYRLKNADEIGIAEYSIRVYFEVPSTIAAAASDEAESAQAPPKWQVPAGSAILRASDPISLDASALSMLGQLAAALYQAGELAGLFQRLSAWLVSTFHADRAWSCLAAQPETPPHLAHGADATGRQWHGPDKVDLLIHRTVQRQQSVLLPAEPTRYSSAMAAPLMAGNESLGLIYVERAPERPSFRKSDLHLLKATGSHAGIRADELLQGSKEILLQRANQQLQWLHQIQERLTPPALPDWDMLEIAAYRQCGQRCCGDVYDAIKLPKGTAGIILGHAAAAGVESALLMAELRAAFRVAVLHADAPHFILAELNWLLYDPASQRAMRCFVGLLDPRSGELHYSVAGQPGAYLLRASGQLSSLTRWQSPAIGISAQSEYQPCEATLQPEDSLILFTRGLITASNETGEPFGIQAVLTALSDAVGQPAHMTLQMLVDDLAAHTGGRQPDDDITILIIKKLE